MTPEARVKKLVSTYLDDLQERLDKHNLEVYKSMIVPYGYGKRNQLDYMLCIYGLFVAIETKAPGEWLTPLQRQTARSILRSGGKVFAITGIEGLNAFKNWVDQSERRYLANRRD